MIHLGEVIGRHGQGIEILDEGTVAGIAKCPFFIEIGEAQDLGKVFLFLNGPQEFRQRHLTLADADVINGLAIPECLLRRKGGVLPPHDDDRLRADGLDEAGCIHPIIDECRAVDRDADHLRFFPPDLFLQIAPWVLIERAVHVSYIEPFPLYVGQELQTSR